METIAGNGVGAVSGEEGPAVLASLFFPGELAFSPEGDLYFLESLGAPGQLLERIDTGGILHRYAGAPFRPVVREGAVDGLQLFTHLVVGADMAVYGWLGKASILAPPATLVRIKDGQIVRVAGGEADCADGYCGAGGAARKAGFGFPRGLAMGPRGDFVVTSDGGAAQPQIAFIRQTLPLPSDVDSAIASSDGAEVYLFDGEGKHLRTLDATTATVLWSMTYDAAGRLIGLTDRDGLSTLIERAGDGSPVAVVAPFGQRTELSLGGDGYLARVTDPAGAAWQMSYSDGLLESFTNRDGHTSHLTYDAVGHLTRDTDPAGGFTDLSRSELANGWRVTKASALGRTSLLDTTYDLAGVQTFRATDPAGLVDTKIDDPGAVITSTSPAGMTTRFVETPDPRFGMSAPLIARVDTTPAGLVRTTQTSRVVALAAPNDPYTLLSRVDLTTLNGKTWTRVYDVSTDVQTSTSPAGRITTQHFDALGHLLELDVPGVLPVTFAYDPQGRLVSTTQGTRVTSQTYATDGWLATTTDPLGRTTSLTRDLLGRVLTEKRPDLAETTFAYDPDGNTTQVVPPGKPAHDFTFDEREQLASYDPPILASGATPTGYSYNLDRQPTEVTQPGPRLVDYQYDTAGRLTQTTFPTGAIARTYDGAGRLATLSGPTGVDLTYSYDGDLLTAIGFSGAVSGSVARTFDNDFRVTAETVNGAWPVAFGYDADSLLTSAGGLQLFRDPQNGRLTGTQIGQVVDSYTYDAYGQVATYSASFGVTPLLSFAYVRDDLGRIVQKTEVEDGVTKVFGYSYDDVGRLVEVTENGNVVESYEYDLNGNRTHSFNSAGSFDATYDEQDRILTYGTLTFTWTPNGEMASKTDTATGAVTTYSYDAVGNLRQVVLPDGTDITYFVDGQGRRVGKVVNGVFERGWLWRGQLQPVAELDATGAVAKRFVYAGGVNVPEVMVTAAGTFRLVTDHLGSVRQVVDQGNGGVVEKIDYDAWGRVGVDSSPGLQPFGFAGGLSELSHGLLRFGRRDYDARSGRWTEKDPARFSAGRNLYAYVDSDPVNWNDPRGLSKFDKLYGLPSRFWNWYHRVEKEKGAADLTRREAEELYQEWVEKGEPGPDHKDGYGWEDFEDDITDLFLPLEFLFYDPCAARPGGCVCGS